eukprot:scaffold5022_cov20-Prasinocladus_malaysianus.AAC.1
MYPTFAWNGLTDRLGFCFLFNYIRQYAARSIVSSAQCSYRGLRGLYGALSNDRQTDTFTPELLNMSNGHYRLSRSTEQ